MTEPIIVSEDRRRVRRTIPVLLAGELIARLKGLLLIPLLTRYFPVSEYGALAQASVLVAVVIPLVFLGSEAGTARVLPGLDDEARRRRFTAWFLAIGGFAAMACLGLLLAHRLVERYLFGRAGLYPALVPILALTILVTVLVNAARSWFRVEQMATALTVVTSAQAILGLVAVALVLAANGSVRLLLAASVAADGVLLVGLVVYLTRLRVWAPPDLRGVEPILRYGLPLLPIGYAIWGMNWFDRLVLVDERGLTEVGIYSLAYSIAYFAVQILANPVWILFPYSSAQLHDTGQQGPLRVLFRKSVLATLLAVVPFIAMTMVVGGPLIDLVAPHGYVAGRHVIPIVMGGYLAQMLASYYEVALGLLHKQWHATIGTCIGLGLNVVLNLVLIPRIGMVGAALATLAGFAFQLVYVAIVSVRIGAATIELSATVRIALAGGAAWVAGSLIHHLVQGGTLGVLVTTSAASAVAYAAALVVTRVVSIDTGTSELRALIKSYRRA